MSWRDSTIIAPVSVCHRVSYAERYSRYKCRQLIEESKVYFRGWDYPHLPRYGNGLINGVDWLEASTESTVMIPTFEYWRFYQSGQFAHLFNCGEDWVGLDYLQIQKCGREPLPER